MDFAGYIAFVGKCREELIKPLKDSDFSELEGIFQISLPLDFKEFYLKYNGDYHPVEYKFYPIKYGFSIEKVIFIKREMGVEYGKKMPFATDGYGHIYVLSLEKDDYGQVLVLNHECEHEQRYEFIAQDFTEFMTEYVLKCRTVLK